MLLIFDEYQIFHAIPVGPAPVYVGKCILWSVKLRFIYRTLPSRPPSAEVTEHRVLPGHCSRAFPELFSVRLPKSDTIWMFIDRLLCQKNHWLSFTLLLFKGYPLIGSYETLITIWLLFSWPWYPYYVCYNKLVIVQLFTTKSIGYEEDACKG